MLLVPALATDGTLYFGTPSADESGMSLVQFAALANCGVADFRFPDIYTISPAVPLLAGHCRQLRLVVLLLPPGVGEHLQQRIEEGPHCRGVLRELIAQHQRRVDAQLILGRVNRGLGR